jgi:hypothetical protein
VQWKVGCAGLHVQIPFSLSASHIFYGFPPESSESRRAYSCYKGRPAAYGLAEVGEALKQGRANHLLLANSFAIPQMICKKCHFHGEGETCPTCGGQMQALNLEELYQQAERTGAEGSAGRG